MTDIGKIMIVAGEASGDAHGAKLVRALREAAPETSFEFFGAAGPKLRDAGVEAVVMHSDEFFRSLGSTRSPERCRCF